MPERNRLIPGSWFFLVLLLSLISAANAGNFLYFMGKDFHELFSTESLLVTGLGGAASSAAYMIENRSGYEGFMGNGFLRNYAEVCDAAFGLPLLGASSIIWAGGALVNSSGIENSGQMLTEGLLITYGMTAVLKLATARTRPDGSDTDSFPSGHSAGNACAAVIVWDRFGPAAGIPAAAIATFTALSRVTLGKHFPSDVIAGAAIGISVGLAVTETHNDDDNSTKPVLTAPGILWTSSGGFGVYF